MHTVVLYTRQGCHLCEDVQALLAQLGVRPQLIDIDAHSELREKYHEWVPVIEINGRVRFKGIVNEVLLARELREPIDGAAAAESRSGESN